MRLPSPHRSLVNRLLICFLSCLTCCFADQDLAETPLPSASAEDNLSSTGVPLAGHSEHGAAYNEGPRQNAYLMGGTGKVDFPVSTDNAQAQAFFDQGLGQLYGFWYYESERSFRRVAALDPDCAMAYWGMALANEDNRDRGKSFIEDAASRKATATEREQMYIDALAAYLTDDGSDKQLRQAYTKALEKIIRKFPADIEAKAMLSVHLWKSSQKGLPIGSHQAVEALLNDVFQVEPMHPAHHFRIHLWDHEEPAYALDSAARCGQAAPTIAHMWHMPGHIYSRLNRFQDAVFQQEASARADHAHMMRDGVLPDQIINYAHNNEWLIRNLVHLGRQQEALVLAKNMLELPRHPKYNSFDKDGMCSCKYGRQRLLQVLSSFEQWEQLIELADTMYLEPTDDKTEQARRWRHLGLAHFYLGQSEELQNCIEALEALLIEFDQAAEKAGEEAAEKKRQELDEAAPNAAALNAAALNAAALNNDAATSAQDNGDPPKAVSDQENVTQPNDEPVGIRKDEDNESDNNEDDDLGEDADQQQDEDEEEKEEKEKELDRCQQIEQARTAAQSEARKGEESVRRGLDELRGLQLLEAGEAEQAIALWKQCDISKSRLAEYYFLAGDHDKAADLCKKAVERGENQVRPLAVQVDLLRRMGRNDAAKAAFERLRTVAGVADLSMPLLIRLGDFAEELAWPADWRTPPAEANDVGNRPDLETLGPFRWSPSPAADWALPDHRTKRIALADYRGQPVVVIFYLGAGCLHCVEQLHEFIPLLAQFQAAGIEVVAISSETVPQLATAIENFSAEGALLEDRGFPIRLVADPQLDVFRRYRAYDDFEQMPLHGTFLIDGEGMVRWQDISYEPFLDAEFLLRESQRLLGP